MKRQDPLQLFRFRFSKLSYICNFFLSLVVTVSLCVEYIAEIDSCYITVRIIILWSTGLRDISSLPATQVTVERLKIILKK